MQYAYKILHFFFFIRVKMSNFQGRTSLLGHYYMAVNWLSIWPPTILQKQATFIRIVGFPGVIGAVDGTHVHIIAPTVNEETYNYQ